MEDVELGGGHGIDHALHRGDGEEVAGRVEHDAAVREARGVVDVDRDADDGERVRAVRGELHELHEGLESAERCPHRVGLQGRVRDAGALDLHVERVVLAHPDVERRRAAVRHLHDEAAERHRGRGRERRHGIHRAHTRGRVEEREVAAERGRERRAVHARRGEGELRRGRRQRRGLEPARADLRQRPQLPDDGRPIHVARRGLGHGRRGRQQDRADQRPHRSIDRRRGSEGEETKVGRRNRGLWSVRRERVRCGTSVSQARGGRRASHTGFDAFMPSHGVRSRRRRSSRRLAVSAASEGGVPLARNGRG